MSPSLASLARALGGDVIGRQVLAPGPGHSARDRSMSVQFSPQAPEGFVAHSFAGDDPMACRDHIRRRMGWAHDGWRTERRAGAATPMRQLYSTTPSREEGVETPPSSVSSRRLSKIDEIRSAADDRAKIERARRIWDEAGNPTGTIVEKYLASRRLELPWEVTYEAIRFHPTCPWRDEVSGQTIRIPAMIAAMRSIATEEITAVHRTRLTEDGRKIDRRMLGKASGSAIMLCPFSAVGGGLTVGEGIETCLAAWKLGWSNVWATGSVGAVASFPVLAGIQSITLLCETDDSGASAKAIDAVGSRYADAGREVMLVSPAIRGDLNDVVQRGAA